MALFKQIREAATEKGEEPGVMWAAAHQIHELAKAAFAKVGTVPVEGEVLEDLVDQDLCRPLGGSNLIKFG